MPIETTQDKITLKTSQEFWNSTESLKDAITVNRDRLKQLIPNSIEYKLIDNNILLMCSQLGKLLNINGNN